MEIINLTINAIRQMSGPEHLRTLKIFIPEFQSKLTQKLRETDLFPDGTIVEILKQKSNPAHHGFKLKSGLVIHIPVEAQEEDTNDNNFVFIAFNCGLNPARVRNNFYTLFQMFEGLNYKTGILINIGRYPDTYLLSIGRNYTETDRLHELSIGYKNGHTHIQHTYFREQGIISKLV